MLERMSGGIGFDDDIKPLFSFADRDCMVSRGLDLWDWWDCREGAGRILNSVETGFIPLGERWSEDKVRTFRQWGDEGCPKHPAEHCAGFFSAIDARTEYAGEPDTSLMPTAITVMGKVLPTWKEYAAVSHMPLGAQGRARLEALLQESELHQAVISIDQLLLDSASPRTSVQ